MCWKLLSKIFKASGLEINNPRDCYVQAFKEGYIEDIHVWNDILLSRNSTAHIYDEADYEQIKNKILEHYMDAIGKLLEKVVLFGSRAKGLETKASDIDLCLTYTGEHKGTVLFELEECVGVYSLDVVFAGAIGKELEKQIARDGHILYAKNTLNP